MQIDWLVEINRICRTTRDRFSAVNGRDLRTFPFSDIVIYVSAATRQDVSRLALNGLAGERERCSGDITTLGGRHGLTSGSTKRDIRCERQPTQTFNRYAQHRELTAHHAADSNSVARQITAAPKISLRFENWFRMQDAISEKY